MLHRLWYEKSIVALFLYPFSLLYRIVVWLRCYYYQHIKSIEKFSAPVIVVGNMTVGGVGKTPLVMLLASQLQKQGYCPGLVSRGYGGKASTWPQVVTRHSSPEMVGDEPVLLVKKTACPMVVGPDRVAAVRMLLKQFPCDVVISDDGLQHYALHRDLEIIVVDGERRFGNGFCLPAGPLRESLGRLKTVNYVICNGGVPQPGEHSMQLVPGAIYRVDDPTLLLMPQDFMQRKIHAVCGIGNPQRFFNSLRSMGFEFTMHVFPDHHHFRHSDIDIADDVIIIMTEKDAVKCQPFVDRRHYCLPVTATCPILQHKVYAGFKN